MREMFPGDAAIENFSEKLLKFSAAKISLITVNKNKHKSQKTFFAHMNQKWEKMFVLFYNVIHSLVKSNCPFLLSPNDLLHTKNLDMSRKSS